MPLPELNARVVKRNAICEHMMILRVAPVGWEIPDFKPGQYAMVGLSSSAPRLNESGIVEGNPGEEKFITRSYSAASLPSQKEYLEFLITLVPEGALTPRLFALRDGDMLWLSKNMSGFFTLEKVPDDTNILILATGSGLSACMGMIRSIEPASKRKVALVHGSRFSCELAYREELEARTQANSHFVYIGCISRPETEATEWQGPTGYIQDVLKSGLIERRWGFQRSPEHTHIFVSGNPAMCDEVSHMASEEGFTEQTYKTEGNLHLEKVW